MTTNPTHAAPFDPASVPTYPVVRMNIDVHDDGTYSGHVDGVLIAEGSEDDVRAACLQAVAARAAARPLKAVRASAVHLDGRTWPMVVQADGTVHDLSKPARRGRPAKTLGIAIGAGVLAVTIIATAAALIATRPNAASAPVTTVTVQPTATPSELPALAPDGWSTHAVWYSPTAATSSPRVIALPDTLVLGTAAGPTTSITALDVATGQPRWAVPLGKTLTAGPELTTVDGETLIAAASSDTLRLIDTAGQTRYKLALDTGAKVTITPGGVIISADNTSARIIQAGTLVARVIPAGGRPVAVLDNSLIVASPTAQWWAITDPATAPDPLLLQAPSPDVRPIGPVGIAGDTLLFAWAPNERPPNPTTTISGHAIAQSMQTTVHLTATAATSTIPRPGEWQPSPDGTWGIYGRTVIDITAGTSTPLPRDWVTATVLNDRAWSRRSRTLLLSTDRAGATTTQTGHVAISVPVANTRELLVVAAEDSDGVRLYGLPATNSTATPLPAETAKK